MEPTLREHFDRAVGADPGAPLGEMAGAAIAAGGRLRRRRRSVTGLAVGLVALAGAGLVLAPDAPGPAGPPVTIAAAMLPATAPSCRPDPVETGATDALVFLTDGAADGRRAAIGTALRDDPRVGAVIFESREQAYQRFRDRWADNPDLLAAVGAAQFPEAYRVRLTAPAEFAALRSEYAATAGVSQVIGRRCAPDAPVGGIR